MQYTRNAAPHDTTLNLVKCSLASIEVYCQLIVIPVALRQSAGPPHRRLARHKSTGPLSSHYDHSRRIATKSRFCGISHGNGRLPMEKGDGQLACKNGLGTLVCQCIQLVRSPVLSITYLMSCLCDGPDRGGCEFGLLGFHPRRTGWLAGTARGSESIY